MFYPRNLIFKKVAPPCLGPLLRPGHAHRGLRCRPHHRPHSHTTGDRWISICSALQIQNFLPWKRYSYICRVRSVSRPSPTIWTLCKHHPRLHLLPIRHYKAKSPRIVLSTEALHHMLFSEANHPVFAFQHKSLVSVASLGFADIWIWNIHTSLFCRQATIANILPIYKVYDNFFFGPIMGKSKK